MERRSVALLLEEPIRSLLQEQFPALRVKQIAPIAEGDDYQVAGAMLLAVLWDADLHGQGR